MYDHLLQHRRYYFATFFRYYRKCELIPQKSYEGCKFSKLVYRCKDITLL
jgi:hypothetical protein